jgi:hypothetical protein
VQAFLNGTSAAILDGHNVPQYCGTGNIRGSQPIFPASSCPNFPGRQQDQAASADPDLGGRSRTAWNFHVPATAGVFLRRRTASRLNLF